MDEVNDEVRREQADVDTEGENASRKARVRESQKRYKWRVLQHAKDEIATE